VSDHDAQLSIDAAFAAALGDVETAVEDYLATGAQPARDALAAALSVLDEWIAFSEDRSHQVLGTGALGISPTGSAIGGWSSTAPVATIGARELACAVELVKAARSEVHSPSLQGLDALRAATGALAASRGGPG